MESEYTQLMDRVKSFVGLLDHAHDEPNSTEAGGPHVERIDFDQLRELLSTVCDRLDEARKIEDETGRVRRRLTARIAALRRGRTIVAADGRPVADAAPAEDGALIDLIQTLEEEAARLHRATASFGRKTFRQGAVHHDYREFK